MISLQYKTIFRATILVSSMVGVVSTTYVWAEESSRVAKSDSGDNAPEAPKLDDSLHDLLKPYADAFGFDLTTPFLGVNKVTNPRDHFLPFDVGKPMEKVEFLDKSFFLLSEDRHVLVYSRGSLRENAQLLPQQNQNNDYYENKAMDLAKRFVQEDIRKSWILRKDKDTSRYTCTQSGVFIYAAAKVIPSKRFGTIETVIPYYEIGIDCESGLVVYYNNSRVVSPNDDDVKTHKENALALAQKKWVGDERPDKVEIKGPLLSHQMNDVTKEIEPSLVWQIYLGTEKVPRRMAIIMRCDNLEVVFFDDMLITF